MTTAMYGGRRSQRPAPHAKPQPHRKTVHGEILDDDYHWLRDPGYPNVTDQQILSYLNAENDHYEAALQPHRPLIEQLYEEIKNRLVDDDESYPFEDRGFFYQWRFAAGGEYRRWFRWPTALGPTPNALDTRCELLIDEPELAAGLAYFRLSDWQLSDDDGYLLICVDTSGDERNELRIFDRSNKVWLDDTITNVAGTALWFATANALIYVELNDAHRPYRVMHHRLGEPQARDQVIYEEQDEGFFVGIRTTQSREYFLLVSGDHVTNEVRLLNRHRPDDTPQLITPRRPQHEYQVDHNGDSLFIRTNDTHKNFRLIRTYVDAPQESNWQELIAPSADRYLKAQIAFTNSIALAVRIGGIDEIQILDLATQEVTQIEFPETLHTAGFGTNAATNLTELRTWYSSMVRPNTVFDFNLSAQQLIARKVQVIPSGYDATQYVSERQWAIARDGTPVPISLVYRKDRDGPRRLHLHAYGAYGIAERPSFSSARISLLDRGFVCALAHVRGGDDLGYHWYEDGKGRKRTNTFNDFIDVAKHLIAAGITSAGQISISGGSAGGTLIGAVINNSPELFGAAVAHVPFVDVLNTMLDASLPLTPIEWPEWGNPNEDIEAFRIIRSYCPYENVRRQAYPPLLVTAGLQDPRVTYWEAAKWVAKLRAHKTDRHPLLLRTNMTAGHGGKSGRFEAIRELAEEYAFVLLTMP